MKGILECLRSQRLRLRILRSDDASAFFRLVTSDLETVRYVQWPVQTAIAEAEMLVSTLVAEIEREEKFYFVADTNGGSTVAFASMKFEEHSAFIGFVVAAAHRRHGYATELISLLVESAFRFDRVSKVEGLCDVDNMASARAMIKAGFVKVEVLERKAMHPNIGSEPRDLARYVIQKQPQQRNAAAAFPSSHPT